MSELVVDFITSLDGYASAEGWPGWWGLEGPEYLTWLRDHPERDYVILMGANTYRLMYGFTKEGEPGTDVLGGMSKVVFSSTLTEPLQWENSTLVAGNAAEAVRKMKDTGDRSMRTIGSVSLCRSLLVAVVGCCCCHGCCQTGHRSGRATVNPTASVWARAPRPGFEPGTYRLTAGRSTVELSGIMLSWSSEEIVPNSTNKFKE